MANVCRFLQNQVLWLLWNRLGVLQRLWLLQLPLLDFTELKYCYLEGGNRTCGNTCYGSCDSGGGVASAKSV